MFKRVSNTLPRMCKFISNLLWGSFESKAEIQKFSFLSVIFGFIIGAYWAMRPIKDSIFHALVDINYQPLAKTFSLVCIFVLILVYNKLLDTYPRQTVFYLLAGVYSALAFVFYFAFSHPIYGLDAASPSPYNIIGWVWYVYVESFGSLIVALFWAFTTDTTSPESGKRGFPMLALFGQIGNILGPYILNTRMLGIPNSAPILLIIGFLMALIGVLFWVFMQVTPSDQLRSYEGSVGTVEESHSDPGFFEGLRLLFTKGYLLGIFAIIGVYEVIVTILDYHLKCSVMATFATEAEQSAYLSSYATWTGIIATACILLGINSIQRRLGMQVSLLLLPVLVAVAVLCTKMYSNSLEVAFWIMVLAKAINYALNQPTLKQLYIPTTRDTKYKAQAWIEMFGSRGAKFLGSQVNMLRGWHFISNYGKTLGVAYFMTAAAGLSFGLIGFWFFVSIYVAKAYNKAIIEDRVVC